MESGGAPAVPTDKNRKIPWPPNPFPKGNPGRPKGAKNHSTRIREQLLSQVGRDAIRRFRHRLRSGDTKAFDKAMDHVIALIGHDKPSVLNIDQSRHTHFTVVLDGANPGTDAIAASSRPTDAEAESGIPAAQ